MMKRKGLGLVLCGLSLNALAQTQTELNQSACKELKQADKELNQIYQQVLAYHQEDKTFINHFKDAQRKWVAFRDAYTDSMYIPEYYQNYGSVMPMCQCYFLEQVTKERLKQLRAWVDGVEEGDACVGSTAD
ncbi:lysozyme inhibitor LprI family protein [Legionella sp. km772]|uniref:lysozyme inhibitor LprI family protein n=1 Tax=Legionella sp. km772 TaxID=2498111 RepID=UPI000F8EB25A|nr:lysozyme inhibitor LprI family protein [Legionella sp. km772]RUR12485.1 DUF1311 domain-containing protein [Legionella sp. km772]